MGVGRSSRAQRRYAGWRSGLVAILLGAAVWLVAGPLASISLAQSCDETWASTSTSGSWSTASNWSPASVPTSSQNVCLPAGSYTVTVTGSQNANSVSVGSGATLAVTISGSNGAALTLNSNGSSTNSGTIDLTDTDATGTGSPVAEILLDSGATLTNDGTILSDAGAAGLGTRVINGQSASSTLDNASDGTITVNQDLQIDNNQNGVFTTAGDVTIATGEKLLVDPSGGSCGGSPIVCTPTFNITGGTITNHGALEQDVSESGPTGNGTLNVSGGTITGTGLLASLPAAVSFTGVGSGTYTFEGVKGATCGGPCTLSGTIGSGQTVVERASNATGPAYLLIDSNVTNDGTIELTDPDTTGSSQEADLAIASGDTLTNDGTILSDPGGAGLGTNEISGTATTGTLNNASDGTITVNQTLQIDSAQNGTFTTSGTVNIATGTKLLVDPSGGACGGSPVVCTPTFNIAGGTITDNGSFTQGVSAAGANASGSVLNATGGTVTGAGLVTAAPSSAGFGDAGSGTYTFEGGGCACTTAMSGTIASGVTVGFNFGVAGGINVDATPSLTNDGTIAPGANALTITGDLINASSGTINVDSTVSITGGNAPSPGFETSGTINIASGQKLSVDQGSVAGTFTIAGGTIANQGTVSDGLNEALSNSLVVTGGTVTGNPVVADSVGASFAGSGMGTFDLIGQFGLLSSDIGAGCTVVLSASGASGPGNAIVTVSTDVVNNGTIELTNPDPSGSATATLDISSGTLTNDGTILSDPGQAGAGSRVIEGAVANNGTVTVNQSLQQPSGTFTNAGVVNVANHQTLTVAGALAQSAGAITLNGGAAALDAPGGVSLSGGTLGGSGAITGNLSNGGEVSPSPSPATLSVTGNYTQSSGGLLAVTNTSTGADQLSVTGSATLGGTLQVATASGFSPTVGSTFRAVTASTVSGTFATTATGGMYAVAYNPTNVTLTALGQSTQPSLSIGNASVRAPSYGTAAATFSVSLSSAQSSAVTVDYATADGTGVAGQDYESTSGQLTFAPGQTTQTVTVNVIGGTFGPPATFFVDLSHPTNAVLGTLRGTGTITHTPAAVGGAVDPSSGGNGGDVTVTIQGNGLYGTPSVELTGPGNPVVTASDVTVAGDGTSLTATFDLTNAALGTRSVVVSEPGTSGSETLANGFTVVPANPPALSVEIAGPPANAPNGTWSGELIYQNLGNDDAENSILEIDGFGPGENVTVPAQYGALESDDGGSTAVVIGVPDIPAGATGAIPVQFTTLGVVGETYTLVPFVLVDSDSSFVPNAADPTATATDQTLASTITAEEDLLTISSSTGGGTLDGRFTATPTSSPSGGILPVPTASETTPDGELQWTLAATLPPEATGPPGAGIAGGSGVAAVIARAEQRRPQFDFKGAWNKVQAIYKGAKNAWDKSQAVIAANKQINLAKQLAAQESALTDCLADKYGLSGLQRLTAKNLAAGSAAMTDFNAIQSATQKIDLNPSESTGVDLMNQIMQGSWAHFMFGGGFFNGASNNYGGALADVPGYANLTPEERYNKALIDCPPPKPKPKPGYLPPASRPPGFFQIPWGKIFFPPAKVTLRASHDPNNITGPFGPGTAHWQAGSPLKPYGYTVEFENESTATAPAYRVDITDQLPRGFNLASFRLGSIQFGDHVVTPPSGVQSWTTRVDLRPAKDEFVIISAALDRSSGTVTWHLTTIDASTGQPIANVTDGFLPPDTVPPEGDGFVSFSVTPNAGMPSGRAINDAARIVFDTNAPIDTPTWITKIDRSRPRSRVLTVRPGTATVHVAVRGHVRRHTRPALRVSWTGSEHYSGIGWFDVYASARGGRFKLALPQTSSRRVSFLCHRGVSYRFYTIAYSAVGNVQRGHSRLSTPVTCR